MSYVVSTLKTDVITIFCYSEKHGIEGYFEEMKSKVRKSVFLNNSYRF